MSWLSRRISASFEGYRRGEEEDQPATTTSLDDDDEEGESEQQSGPLHGKGVKEDLSELTKTFTQQLWGVASFLAPPPHPVRSPNDELAPSSDSGSNSADEVLPLDHVSTSESIVRMRHSLLQIDPISIGQSASTNDLLDTHLQTSMKEILHETFDGSQELTGASQDAAGNVSERDRPPGNAFTGISNDLAELRGSLATGFCRMMKIMREEVDPDELSTSFEEDELNPDAEVMDDSETSEQVSSFSSEDFYSANKATDSGDNPSHSSRVSRAITVPRTIDDGLDGISKLASTLFLANLDSEDEDSPQVQKFHKAVGITEEVLAFARNISMHPETWLDFPLFTDDEEDDDFEMSDAQMEHVSQVELAAPRLAALRIELCPGYMTEGCFWKIYFVLLHPRLSKADADLLSTPQLMEARKLLLSKLQRGAQAAKAKESGTLLESPPKMAESFKIVSLQATMKVPARDFHQVGDLGSSKGRPRSSIQNDCGEEIQNKTVLASTVKLAALTCAEEADADRWLDDEPSPHIGLGTRLVGNDEDVSFSDLEDEDDLFTSKLVESKRPSEWAGINKDQSSLQGNEQLSSQCKTQGEHGRGVLSLGKYPTKRLDTGWPTYGEDDVTIADFE